MRYKYHESCPSTQFIINKTMSCVEKPILNFYKALQIVEDKHCREFRTCNDCINYFNKGTTHLEILKERDRLV